MALIPGTGSALYTNADKTIVFKGNINQGPVSPLTPKAGEGFTLAGNPFTSVIDWNSDAWTRSNIAASTWVWDQLNQQYAVYNGTIGTFGASRYLAMGQGFFVQATNSDAELAIPEAARTSTIVSPLFRSAVAEPEQVKIKVRGNGYSDEAIVMIATDALPGTDYRYDALKMAGSADAPQLSTVKDGSNFTIASINAIDSLTVIPVTLIVGKAGSYSMNVTNTLNTNSLNTFLVDKLTGSSTLIDAAEAVSFSASPSDRSDRFEIVFRSQTVITALPKNGEQRGEIKIWNSGRKLNIEIPSNEELVSADIYTMNGLKVRTITSGSLRDIDTGLGATLYLVRVKTSAQVKTGRVVIM